MGTASALPQYRAEEILAPRDTEFRGMNSLGVVVGRSPHATGVSGVIRHVNSTLVFVSPPPGYEGYQVNFTDINNSGQIAGTLIHAFNGTGKGFVYTEEGGFRIMNSAPNEAIASSSMTEDGLMAFTFSGGSGLWNPDTNAFTPIAQYGLRSAREGGRATGRNWSWHNGTFTSLQTNGLAFSQSIASSGVVVGYKLLNGRMSAQFWNENGTLRYSDDNFQFHSILNDINTSEIGVGARAAIGGNVVGTIFTMELGHVDVNSLIVEQDFSGGVGELLGIEDNGKIFGRRVTNGSYQHFYLEPVPEPGTVVALSAGLAALLRRKRTT